MGNTKWQDRTVEVTLNNQEISILKASLSLLIGYISNVADDDCTGGKEAKEKFLIETKELMEKIDYSKNK